MRTQAVHVAYEAQPKVPLTEFVPELAFEFNEIPEEVFPNYLLRAITRFARQTNALRRTAEIPVQECVENYLLEPEDCMDIIAVMGMCQVRSNGCRGPVVRLTSKPCQIWGGLYSWVESPNTIVIHPARYNDVFEVEFSVMPTYDACEVDRLLLTQYYDTIIAGTKYYLYNMNGKSWSDEVRNARFRVSSARASENLALFLSGCAEAAVETMMHGQRGAIRAKRPRVLY